MPMGKWKCQWRDGEEKRGKRKLKDSLWLEKETVRKGKMYGSRIGDNQRSFK